jgi:hypothetical protein
MARDDFRRCIALHVEAGYYELGFLREKENSLPLEFREQFIWVKPSSPVGIDV